MNRLISGADPVGVRAWLGPAAVVPAPLRTCVMPVPGLPHVIRARPLDADFVPEGRPRGVHDADVEVARHESHARRHRGLRLRSRCTREGHAGSQDEKSGSKSEVLGFYHADDSASGTPRPRVKTILKNISLWRLNGRLTRVSLIVP